MAKRKVAPVFVKEEVADLSFFELEGDIDYAIEYLQAKRQQCKEELRSTKKWTEDSKLVLSKRTRRYDDGEYFSLVHERPENKAEKEMRLELEQKQKAGLLERDRREFERLQKLFNK